MSDFLIPHWQILDLFLAITGLVVYGVASHTLRQRRHPSAAMAWLMGLLLFPWLTLPLFLLLGNRVKRL